MLTFIEWIDSFGMTPEWALAFWLAYVMLSALIVWSLTRVGGDE